jgi:acyl dehydratase
MALDKKHLGKEYGPFRSTVGLEKLREFSSVVAGGAPSLGTLVPPPGLNPLLHDEEAAKRGPWGDVIAFPTFGVTFAIAPFSAAITDPELGINVLMLVHGEQELEWFGVIKPGDVMTTTGKITQLASKAGRDFLTVETESVNQRGEKILRGEWTAVVRSA